MYSALTGGVLMKIDLYTRVTLTGILLCLVWLCIVLTPVGTPLTAQALPGGLPVQDVRIVGVKQPEMSQSVTGGAAKPIGDWDSLPTYSSPQAKVDRAR
jgi:hypothetical protein